MGIVKIEATSECLVCLTYFGASFTYKLRVVVCLWYVMDNLESNDACCAQLWGVGLVLICSFEAFWKFHWTNSLSSLQCTYSMSRTCACAKHFMHGPDDVCRHDKNYSGCAVLHNTKPHTSDEVMWQGQWTCGVRGKLLVQWQWWTARDIVTLSTNHNGRLVATRVWTRNCP